MRHLKLVFISLLFFFLLITLMSLLIPSNIRISKAINLKQDSLSVFHWIREKQKWTLWHPAFQQQDNPAQRKWQNETEWTRRTGNDSLLIVELKTKSKAPVINGWRIHRFSGSDSLTLQWYMDFRLSWYPWQKFRSLFYEGTYGTMMEKGLTNLKGLMQQ